MLAKGYTVFGACCLILYAATWMFGWEFGHAKSQIVPATVRSSPGGYRSFHFWHSGYHGGK